MSARSKARKRALDLIYAAEVRGRSPLDEMTEQGEPHNPYTAVLVNGVSDHAGDLDAIIERYAEGWTLQRMPAVDRNILRMGIFEVLYVDDVPDAVAVSEALNLAGELSTDDSPTFVNGILGAVVRDKEQLTA